MVMLILVTASILGCLHTLVQTMLPPAPAMCCTVQLAILGRESSVCIGLDAVLSCKSWAELHKLSQSSFPIHYDHFTHWAALERWDLFAQCCDNSLYREKSALSGANKTLWFLSQNWCAVRHSGKSELALFTPDCKASSKCLFFFIL